MYPLVKMNQIINISSLLLFGFILISQIWTYSGSFGYREWELAEKTTHMSYVFLWHWNQKFLLYISPCYLIFHLRSRMIVLNYLLSVSWTGKRLEMFLSLSQTQKTTSYYPRSHMKYNIKKVCTITIFG
jgi:hypothetical protein